MSAIMHSLEGAFSDGRTLSEKLTMRQNVFCRRKAQGGRKLAVCGMQLPLSVYIEVYGRGKCKPDKLRKIKLEASNKGKGKINFAWSLENDCRLHIGCQNISKVKISSIKRDDCKF